MQKYQDMKNAAIARCEATLAGATRDSEIHAAKMALIVAQHKPIGAFVTEERERERDAYNRNLYKLAA